jgi:imidazolonepropionase
MTDPQDDMIIHNIGRLYTFPGTGPVNGNDMDEPEIIENSAIAISDGKITSVGNTDDVWKEADLGENGVCIDAERGCVVPGFVDPHTHAVFAGSREFEIPMKLKGASYLDILEAGGGILRTMTDTRKVTLEELVRQLNARLDKMMRYGTTTAEIKTGYGLDHESEMKMLSAIKTSEHPMEKVATFLGPHAIPPEYSSDPDGFLDLMIDMLPEIAENGLARFADIFCERGVFDAEQSERFLSSALREGLRPKIHSDEIENLGGTVVGAELGAVSADHLLRSTDEDLEAMLKAGTVPVLLPGTLLTIFEEKVPRARNMMIIPALSCYRRRMTPNETLAASTVNAAHAIGLSDRKGRISPGFDADILIMKDPSLDHVIYNFGVNHVRTVIGKGRVMLNDVSW